MGYLGKRMGEIAQREFDDIPQDSPTAPSPTAPSPETGNEKNDFAQLGERGLSDLASAAHSVQNRVMAPIGHGAMHLLNAAGNATENEFNSARDGWDQAPFSADTLEKSGMVLLAAGGVAALGMGALALG